MFADRTLAHLVESAEARLALAMGRLVQAHDSAALVVPVGERGRRLGALGGAGRESVYRSAYLLIRRGGRRRGIPLGHHPAYETAIEAARRDAE